MKRTRYLTLLCVLGLYFLGGCASNERGLVYSDAKGWSGYSRCSNVGYFRIVDGFEETIYVSTTDKEAKNYGLSWYIRGGGDDLHVQFKADSPQVEIVAEPNIVETTSNIKFVLDQTITDKHPEIPEGMEIKYDFDKKVVVYGTKNYWKPDPFEPKGELKSPRYLKREELAPLINGKPDQGYKRNYMVAYFKIGILDTEEKKAESIVVTLPEYTLNGVQSPSRNFRFHFSKVSSHRSSKCIYWQAGFPGFFQKTWYRLNPFN